MTGLSDSNYSRRSRKRTTSRHSAARLAAVQALYQLEMGGGSVSKIIEEFVVHRLGLADVEVSRGTKPNQNLFELLVEGAESKSAEITTFVGPLLAKGWVYERLDVTLKSILRLGTFELTNRLEVPAAVLIEEYVQITDAFFSKSEPSVVNGILDGIARNVRPGELETRNDGSSDAAR